MTPRTRRLPSVLAGGGSIAVAMGIMNVATYGFTMLAARILGPVDYGAIASLMALLMVIAVLQLGLQATAARRISATPDHVGQIERVILDVTYRSALVLGAVLLVLSPVVDAVLRLDSLFAAAMIAVAAVPLTVMGGQAGILQGERRWAPLALLYLAMGLPRLVIGGLFIWVRPTENSAMLAVTIGLLAPVAVGWFALRSTRAPHEHSEDHAAASILRETFYNSQALLAFFVLSNTDVIVARNVLDSTEAGLYAGGLILTKAVLFLPQFVVIIAFPSMSTVEERKRALVQSLTLVAALGALATLGALLLSHVAMVFVGGSGYAAVEARLWKFAVVGTLLASLQLVVYSVLARRSQRSAVFVWAAVVALVAASPWLDTLDALVATVIAIDATLLALLLGISLYRMRDGAPQTEPTPPTLA